MARVADLLTVLHQIDSLRGKCCATCKHYVQIPEFNGAGRCMQGYRPYGADDGCDDWQSIQNDREAS